ncbi:hypothetical protein AB6805_14095 [Chitinophaga sp. RCC_12]|uniref:hypothetical protein n=1 Tax=Chitinophaga sp. RCC_12 TaxID=3239226 RepID=UPI0035237FC9
MGISPLGIFHTIIGVVAIIAGLASFFKFGKISLAHQSGKVYFLGTLVTSLTALGISRHGGFNPGHALSLLVIVLIGISYFLFKRKQESKKARYWENFAFSFSFFLSMIPTVNETLTRIPLHHPLASGPGDPVVGRTLLVVLVLFIAGAVYQFIKQKKINKSAGIG